MATEQVVEQVAEHVADNLEEAAVVVRHFNTQKIAYSVGGLAVGIAIGFFIGYRWNRAKIRAEAFKESEEEVEKIRELYRDARDSVKIVSTKPPLEEVVEEQGYVEPERPTRPPVPAGPPRERLFAEPVPTIKLETGKSKNTGWDFEEEVATRSEEHPYIIHQDEYQANEKGYTQEVLTWYAGDEVLTDEDEDPIENADDVVDLNHMSRFGHGTDDFNVVFIRNDILEKEFEICRMPTSYAEEVQGLSDNDEPH